MLIKTHKSGEIKCHQLELGKLQIHCIQKKPSILPFKGKSFPLVESYDVPVFLDETRRSNKFDELRDEIKSLTRTAEKIKFLDSSFKNYLKNKEISENQFDAKNPKIKQDILYDWLFTNKIDVGVLML